MNGQQAKRADVLRRGLQHADPPVMVHVTWGDVSLCSPWSGLVLLGPPALVARLAVVLTGLGVTTLSMTARSIAAVAAVLKTVSLAEAQELAKLALSAPSATDARAWVRAKLPVLEELGL